jgi:transcriptional regulator with XRE-family HTH domain
MDELAKKAHVSKMTIYRLEKGIGIARPSTVRKLAEALGVAPEELIS